jgi:hypothetical protein
MVMAMGKSVKMAVTMDKAFMLVSVFVNQVYPQKEVHIIQDLFRGSIGDQGMVFGHDIGPVGDFLQNGEVVSGGYDRLPQSVQFIQDFNEPNLGPGVQSGGRFIQKQDVGIQGQD